MVTRKGRRKKLIKQLQEVIYDIGKPATAGEILSNCFHLRNAPTMNQLCMMLRRHSEFTIVGTIKRATTTGDYSAKLYWLSNTDEISKLLKCSICKETMPKRCTNSMQKCSICYKEFQKQERRATKYSHRKLKLCIICEDEITNNNTKYCSVDCRKCATKKRRKNA